MTIETEIASLTQATTDLISAVNVKKAALDSAEANAVGALDDFETQYIGARASAPATDADGDPLITGALYYNTSNTTMFVYTGTAWDALVDNLVVDPNATITSNIATNGNDIKFGDNDKATFGASDDLQIYHDGSKNRVIGSVDVTGTVTADGLTIDGDVSTGGLLSAGQTANLDVGAISSAPYPAARISGYRNSGSFASTMNLSTMNGTGSILRRVGIDFNGDVSFFEDTGTTAKMVWDASAESLGIGFGSPAYALDIEKGSADAIRLKTTNASTSSLLLDVKGGATTLASTGLRANSSGSLSILTGTSSASEAMRIDSAGNLSIGATVAQSKLYINNGADNDVILRVDGADNSSEYISLGVNGGNGVITGGGVGTTSTGLVFRTASSGAETERARLDSSGNLLVGKTSLNGNTAGFQVEPAGALAVTRSGSTTAYFNRLSSDGEIAAFRKDGATVGSIGTKSNDIYIADSPVGLRIRGGTSQIAPCDGDGNLNDASVDLGNSTARFKDLYLSGGVYLGGTGAANRLDDYETGTWTPTLGGTWTSNPTALSGTYVKIGKLVYIQMVMSGGAKSSSISAWFDGLPFNISVGSTGSVSDSGVNDKGNCLLANGDNVWLTDTSFSGTTYITATYETTE